MPYICNSVTPYISSNCSHCCAVKGAVEQLISRKARHVLRGVADRLVQQDVEHGRHAGREGDAVLLHPFEEAAVREPLGDVHGQALLQERQQAQHLRRVPAERAVFQGAVVLGQPEEFQRVEAVHPVGGVVVDDDLRPRRGARGAEDAGGVGGIVALGQLRRVALRQRRRTARPAGLSRRPATTRRSGRARPARRRPSPQRRSPCDRGSARASARRSASTICFSLISRLNGQITAPIRQTPNQISSFSRHSSDSTRTRLPFADALALEIGRDVDRRCGRAGRNRWRCRIPDRRWRSWPGRAWRISPAGPRPAHRES